MKRGTIIFIPFPFDDQQMEEPTCPGCFSKTVFGQHNSGFYYESNFKTNAK